MARILVIDDDLLFLRSLELLLGTAGHEVATATDGLKASRSFRADPFDLVITDIFMPNREGIETIVTLRREFPGIEVIAMSGGSAMSATFLKAAAHLGARRTLSKPFTSQQLHSAIAEALAASRATTA
ncbi:MAG: response regulator [Opitutaceae bacterium]